MLDVVNLWCSKWRLMMNQTKTQIMHFRKKGTDRSQFDFSFGVLPLEFTDAYKYLGFTLDEFVS